MNVNQNPSIYIACLASKNRQQTYGRWLDATQDERSIYQAIADVLKNSPIPDADEWVILDHFGFGSLIIDTGLGIAFICKAARLIQIYGDIAIALLDDYEYDIDYAERLLGECYCGKWDHECEFSIQTFNAFYRIPESAHIYIDYEKFNRDLFVADYFSLTVNGMVHVFSNG